MGSPFSKARKISFNIRMESPESEPVSPVRDAVTTLTTPSNKKELQNELISKLREEGILPLSVNKDGFCYYVSMNGEVEQQPAVVGKKRRIKKFKTNRRQNTGSPIQEDKMVKAEELHQEKMFEKGESGRSYKERFNRVRQYQERKAEELRLKLERKMQNAEDRLCEKVKLGDRKDTNKKLRLAKERREALDKEFRDRSEQKLLEEEERMKNLEDGQVKPTMVDEKLNRALFRREEYLRERQNLYLNKMKTIEKNRKRRDEILRGQRSARSRSKAPY